MRMFVEGIDIIIERKNRVRLWEMDVHLNAENVGTVTVFTGGWDMSIRPPHTTGRERVSERLEIPVFMRVCGCWRMAKTEG